MARKPLASRPVDQTPTTDMSEAPKSSAAVKRGLSSTAEKRRGLSSAAEKRGLSSTAVKRGLSSTAEKSGVSSTAEKSGVSSTAEKRGLSSTAEKESRIWHGEDVLTLINGLAEFQTQNKDFDGQMGDKFVQGFHDFIKDSLMCSVSKGQLGSKLKRLKKKYRLIAGKIENDEPVSSQDSKIFKLGTKVWGHESVKKGKMSGVRGISKEEQVEDKRSDTDSGEDDDGLSQYPYFEAGCGLLPDCFKVDKKRMSSVALADKKVLEKSWSLYFEEAASLKVKRLGLLHRHCMMMMRPTGDSGTGKNLV